MTDTLDGIAASAFAHTCKWLSNNIGLPEDFFDSLSKENDWMIAVKAHALLETCVNHMLTKHFGTADLGGVFARLEMSNPKTGKMAFVSACELLPKPHRTFIQKLSEMRNFAVHDIKHFSFTFKSFMEAMDKKEIPAWKKQIGFFLSDETAREKYFAESPSNVVVFGCLFVVIQVILHSMKKDLEVDSPFDGLGLPIEFVGKA